MTTKRLTITGGPNKEVLSEGFERTERTGDGSLMTFDFTITDFGHKKIFLFNINALKFEDRSVNYIFIDGIIKEKVSGSVNLQVNGYYHLLKKTGFVNLVV